MMDIYMLQYTYQSNHLVVINENTYVSAYKNEKNKFDQPFLSFQARNVSIDKSKFCDMTKLSGALEIYNFDGKTILLEREDIKYIYISGLEIFEFRTHDKIPSYISLMGNNMIPYTFAFGKKYAYFISTHYKFFGNDNIQEDMLLKSSLDSLDPYDYHLSKNGLNCSKKLLDCIRIHRSWLSMECGHVGEIVEDE